MIVFVDDRNDLVIHFFLEHAISFEDEFEVDDERACTTQALLIVPSALM
jgi:hypothetical protein